MNTIIATTQKEEVINFMKVSFNINRQYLEGLLSYQEAKSAICEQASYQTIPPMHLTNVLEDSLGQLESVQYMIEEEII